MVSLDLPVAGAYTREGIDIFTSWREAIDRLFRTQEDRGEPLNQTLLDLLMLLHGEPGKSSDAVPVNCPLDGCDRKDIPVTSSGGSCPACEAVLYPTDTLRIHEEVAEEGTNEAALGRLMLVVELLVFVGLTSLLWQQSRNELLCSTLFIVDGPLARYGPPANSVAGRLSTSRLCLPPHPWMAPVFARWRRQGQ